MWENRLRRLGLMYRRVSSRALEIPGTELTSEFSASTALCCLPRSSVLKSSSRVPIGEMIECDEIGEVSHPGGRQEILHVLGRLREKVRRSLQTLYGSLKRSAIILSRGERFVAEFYDDRKTHCKNRRGNYLRISVASTAHPQELVEQSARRRDTEFRRRENFQRTVQHQLPSQHCSQSSEGHSNRKQRRRFAVTEKDCDAFC